MPLGVDRAIHVSRLTHLRLGPLTEGAIHDLIGLRLGIALPRPTLVRLHAASGDNPFFALEIARALLQLGEPVAPGDALPVPSSLSALLEDRLHRLSDEARYVLLVAAVALHPTVSVVSEAVGNMEGTRRALAQATDADVASISGDRVRFAHPLLASAVAPPRPPPSWGSSRSPEHPPRTARAWSSA
jgi:hypothetical protein